MIKFIQNRLLLLSHIVILILFYGCLNPTDTNELMTKNSLDIKSQELNYCQGDTLYDLPFGNSSSGGDGLTKETAFIICNSTQFNQIGLLSDTWDKHFILMADINLIEFKNEDYHQIGTEKKPFTGELDGNNKTIYNFIITHGEENRVGLFSNIATPSVVKNLSIEDVKVIGHNYVAVLTAVNHGGLIDNVHIDADYVIGNHYVGGITAVHSLGKIVNSSVTFNPFNVSADDNVDDEEYEDIDLYGNKYVGGIAGMIDSGSVNDSSVEIDKIRNNGSYTGGIAGYNVEGIIRDVNVEISTSLIGYSNAGGVVGRNNGTVIHAYGIIKDVIGVGDNIGGIIGYNQNGWLFESNIIVNSSVVGRDYVGGLIGCSHEGIIEQSELFVNRVGGREQVGGIIGRTFNTQLLKINGIVESEVKGSCEIIVGELYNSGIDPEENCKINKDGQSCFVIIDSDPMSTACTIVGGKIGGIVGSSNYSKFQDLYIIADSVRSDYRYSGGGIGYSIYNEIRNTTAHISEEVAGQQFVGGMIGKNDKSNIYHSSSIVNKVIGEATSSVIENGNYIGGFIGYNSGENGGPVCEENVIEDDEEDLTVYANIVNNPCDVGSSISMNDRFVVPFNLTDEEIINSEFGRVERSSAHISGVVSGKSYIGGFVGCNGCDGAEKAGDISISYAEIIDINASGPYVDGFIGKNNQELEEVVCDEDEDLNDEDHFNIHYISNCFVDSSGVITGTHHLGGFVGSLDYSTITSSYAIATLVNSTESLTDSSGGVGGFVGTLDHSEVKSSFAVTEVRGTYSKDADDGFNSKVGKFFGSFDVNDATGEDIEFVLDGDQRWSSADHTNRTEESRVISVYVDDQEPCWNNETNKSCNTGRLCKKINFDTDEEEEICNDFSEHVNHVDLSSDSGNYFHNKNNLPMNNWDFDSLWLDQNDINEYPTLILSL